jgi:hypothetical protein
MRRRAWSVVAPTSHDWGGGAAGLRSTARQAAEGARVVSAGTGAGARLPPPAGAPWGLSCAAQGAKCSWLLGGRVLQLNCRITLRLPAY